MTVANGTGAMGADEANTSLGLGDGRRKGFAVLGDKPHRVFYGEGVMVIFQGSGVSTLPHRNLKSILFLGKDEPHEF